MCARHPLRRRPLISPPTSRVAAPACQDYYIIAAVRDPAKMHAAAKKAGVASTDYAAVELQQIPELEAREVWEEVPLRVL